MGKEYWWEKYRPQGWQRNGNTQQSNQQGNAQKSTQKSYWWDEYDKKAAEQGNKGYWWDDGSTGKTVAANIADRVNTWLENHDNYVTNYRIRYAGRKNSYEDSYVSDSGSWLDKVNKQADAFDAERQSILSYMDNYKGYLDDEWMENVRKVLDNGSNIQQQIRNTAAKDNEWWNSFGADADLVKKYGSAEGVYNFYQRTDGYNKKYAGMGNDDIQKALSTLGEGEEKEWLDSYQWRRYFDEPDFDKYSKAGAAIKNPTMAEAEDNGRFLWWEWDGEEVGNIVTYSRENADMLAIAKANNENTQGNILYRSMDDDEVRLYNYLLAKYGKERGDEFLSYIHDDLAAREGGALASRLKGIDIPVIEELAIGAFGLLAGVDQWARGTRQYFSDEVQPSSIEQYANSAIADSLNGFGKYAYQATNVVGNMLPSIAMSRGLGALGAGMKAARTAGLSTMFVGAAGNAYADGVKEYGMEPWQARVYGNLVGIAEVALEGAIGGIPGLSNTDDFLSAKIKVIDNSLLRVGAKIGWDNVKEIVEEEAQNYLEPLFRSFFTGEYDAPTFEELLETAIVTSLSTPAMGGVGTTIDDIKGGRDAFVKYGNKTKDLIKEGLLSNAESDSFKLAQKYKQQEIEGKTLSGNQIRNLLAANQEQITPKDMKIIQKAAEKRLTELGQTKDVERVAELATKYATGQKLTKAEKSFLARSEYGSRVVNELTPKNIESGEYATGWAEEIGTKYVNAEAYNKTKIDQAKAAFAEMKKMAEAKTAEEPAKYKSLTERIGTDGRFSVSESGKAVIRATNEEIDINNLEIVSVGDGKMIFKVDEGREVSAGEIDFVDDNQSYLVSAVSNIENITPASAMEVMKLVDTSKPLGVQLNAIDEAFTYGNHGYSEADLKAGDFSKNLTKDQLMRAYELGKAARLETDYYKEDTYKKMRTAAEAKMTAEKKAAKQKAQIESDNVEVYFEDGGKVVKFDEHTGKYDDKRTAAVNTAKFLSKLGIGGKYYFFKSYLSKTLKDKDGNAVRVYKDANGKEVPAPNGAFYASDGSIHIDLNAGDAGQGTALFTMGHELGHFVKAYSAKQFKILGDLVKEAFDKTKLSMHERVLAKQKFLQDKRRKDAKVTYDEAYEEVVCDALSTMLTDGSFYDTLMEIKVKDKGLFNTIKRFFQKMIAKFNKAYAELTPDQRDAQDIRELKDMFDKIQTAFVEGLVEASENFQVAEVQKNTTEDGDVGDTKDSIRRTRNMTLEEQLSAYYGKKFKRSDSFYFGITPNILSRSSLDADPLAFSQDDFAKSTRIKHKIPRRVLKKLKENLAKPIFSFTAGKQAAIVIDDIDGDGKPVVVAIHGGHNMDRKPVNRIASIYGVDSIKEWVETQIEGGGKFRVYDIEKANAMLQTEGYLAEVGAESIDSWDIISEIDPLVKSELAEALDIEADEKTESVAPAVLKSVLKEGQAMYSYRGKNKDGIEVYETSQDIKNLTRKERQQQFLDIMTNEYRGRTAKFIRNGHVYYATFDEKDVNKNIYGDKRSDKKGYRAKINAGADGDIFELVENSKYNGSLPETGKKITAHRGVGFWDYFIKNVQIDGVVFDLTANVRKKADGAFVYSIQLRENKKIKASPPLGLLLKALNGVTNASATKVPQPNQKVKKNSDRAFLDAVNRGDMATVKKMVDAYAIEQGFDTDEDGAPDLLFHGTDSFGFTKIDTAKSDDGATFWATPNMGVAGSYYKGSSYKVRELGREKVTPKGKKLDYYSSMEKVVNAAKPFSAELGQDLSKAKFANEAKVMKKARNSMQRAVAASETVLSGDFSNAIQKIAQKVIAASREGTYDAWAKAINQNNWQQFSETTGVKFWELDLPDNFNPDKSDISKVTQVDPDVFRMMYHIGDVLNDLGRDDTGTLKGETIDKSDIIDSYNDLVAEKGIYGFYHKQDNPFVYDCSGAAWNKIAVPNEAKGHFAKDTVTTRQLAEWAFANGYDAIKLDNVVDVGGYALKEARVPATVWAFKNPQSQIKSADPVTYDDNGNVIPLSERFNTENDDIRRSERGEGSSNRDLLANAFETLSQNSEEYKMIQDYREKIEKLNKLDDKLSKINAEIRKVRFEKGNYDVERLARLEEKAKETAKEINREDKKLLQMEASEPLRKVIAQERKKAAQQTKAHVKEIQQNKKLRAEQTELRHKIRNFKKNMESALLKPTDRKYVPVDLVQAMVDVCNLIDTDTDLYKADGSINKAQQKREETKEKLQNLKDEYEKLKTPSDPLYKGEFDEQVYAYLTELKNEFSDRNLTDMTKDELTKMYEYLKSINGVLMGAKKLIGWNEGLGVYEAGDAVIDEQIAITKSRKNGKRNIFQKANDGAINLSLAPVRNVERMSGYNADSYLLKLFKRFEQGIRKKNKFVMEAYKSFEHLTSSNEYEDSIYKEVGGKKYTDVKGREFGISKMQMMQAILSFEREQANKNLHHIENGGFTFADLDMLSKGKLKEAVSAEHSHRVPAAAGLVAEFTEILKNDKWCQDYMEASRKFFNETAKNAINETSIALKHRIIAKDKSYIPFEVDTDFVNLEITDMDAVQKTINGYGMLKDTQDHAPQPLYITGLNNILDRHIDQVGNVYGLAIEVRNFNKVWNVKSTDGLNTVKEMIETNWGKSGVEHIEQAVKDIQGPRIRERNALTNLYYKAKSHYIGSTFLFNLSVVTKQIGSLFSSNSMLRWRDPARQIGNLIYTMANHDKISAEVDRYTASAWMRRQGVSDAELHTLMTEGKKSRLGRLLAKVPAIINPTKWIVAMDHAVALSLWRYAKQDTAKRTGLKGEELLKATAEFYDEVIENTQSMTDVLHRPEIQKQSNVLAESFAMFKTDLYQMAGQLHVTAGRYMANKTKENGMALGKTVVSATGSLIWGQLMTTVFALLRYKVWRYRDDEDEEITAESWLKRQGFSAFGDAVGYIFPVFGSEIVGFFENIKYGETDDIADSLALTLINDLYNALTTIGTSVKDGEMPEPEDMENLVVKALQVFGIPSSNIKRTIEAIKLHAEDIANGEFLSFNAGNKPKSHELYKAIIGGDTKYVEREKQKSKYKDKDGNFDKGKYNSAIRTALKQNDPRIREAAQAYYDGDLTEYKRIFKEIRDEDKKNGDLIGFDNIMESVMSEVSKIKGKNEPKTESSEYSATDFVNAILVGDADMAHSVREDIIYHKVANGKTREDASEDFESSVATSTRNAFDSGLLDEEGAESLLLDYAGMGEQAAATKVKYWSFIKKHPQYRGELSQAQVEKYWEFAEPAEIPVDVFVQYLDGTKDLKTIKDEWGDEVKSKRDQVLEVIDSLPLIWQQKDALYLAFGYEESTIWDVPW